jgi:hypothetical protein
MSDLTYPVNPRNLIRSKGFRGAGHLAMASSLAMLGLMPSLPTRELPNMVSCMNRHVFCGEMDRLCSLHCSRNTHRRCRTSANSSPARALSSSNVSKCILVVRLCSVLQTYLNVPRFLPIFPDSLERLSHLAPINYPLSPKTTKCSSPVIV